MDKENGQRAKTISRLLDEGVFIAREDLVLAKEAHKILTGKELEILGDTLRNGVTTLRPNEMIGIKLNLEEVRNYDGFWNKFLDLRSARDK